MIIVTALNIKGKITFEFEDDHLILKNEKEDYLLRYVGKNNLNLLKNNKGILVEVGNGRMLAEHEIVLNF